MTVTRHLLARRRTRLRRWALCAVLTTSLALSGCGTEDDPKVAPTESTGTPTPTPTADDPADPDAVAHREIGTFSAPGLRGVEDGATVPLDGEAGARAWLDGLGAAPATVDEVTAAIETEAVTDDETLHGLVLHTGCLAPQSWTLRRESGELTVRVVPDKKEATVDCVATVTTLAVVAVPND